MCGIAGIFNSRGDEGLQEQLIRRMLGAIRHRGPDEWGVYLSPRVTLGSARLSIVDLAEGHQPMTSERYVIAYNGEIYNYIELRKDLENSGVVFKTQSDTEVILKCFEAYGEESFRKFNGQFALLIWDKKNKQLIAARDRFGVRPLYVLHLNSRFYFASEMKSFDTLEGYRRVFDVGNLYQHALLWNTWGDRTVFQGIRSVQAGTYEIYKPEASPVAHRYYEIGESQESDLPKDLETATAEFMELLEDAVRLRLRSDVPVANYLSGGIDSSVVTYLTAKINRARFKTYSIGFADSDFDETPFQREMVDRVGSEHQAIQVNYRAIDENFLDALYYTERPLFRTAPVPLYLLSKEVNRDGIKVVLTGEGADEVLYGYDSYKELKLLEFWSRHPESSTRAHLIRKLYPHLSHYADPKQFGFMRMYYEGFLKNFDNDLVGLNIRVHNNSAIHRFFNQDHHVGDVEKTLLAELQAGLPANFSSWSLLQKNQFLEMRTLLSGYLLSSQGDRMSMAHSVEGRYPFLDHRLVERVFYYPDRMKLCGFSQKHILRRAFRGQIPEGIIQRPKLPYQAPDLKSFYHTGVLSETAAHFLSEQSLKQYGIFNETEVAKFLRKFSRGVPERIGYRDNMFFTFILSCQMIASHTVSPRDVKLDEHRRTVILRDM